MPVWGTLAAITLARIAFGYEVQTVASVAPDLLAHFAMALALVGTLMGLYLMPGIAAAIPFGILGRRFGEFWVLAGGLVLMAAGNFVSAVAADPFGIGLGRVVAGTGAVALTVMQAKVVADRFHGNRFVLGMSVLVAAFPVGIGLAQVTQSRLSHAFGWPWAFVAGGGVAILALLVFVATWHEANPNRVRTLRFPSPPESLRCVIAGLIWTAYNAGYFNFLGYMPTYLARHGHPSWEADVVIGIGTWGNTPAIVLGGVLVARFGALPVFLVGASASSVSILGMAFADWPLLWGTIFGTLASIHAALIVAKGTLSARPENRAVGMALFYTTYYLGGFFIPPLCGRVADLVGDPSGAFLCAGLISALAIPFYLLHVWASRAPARMEVVG